MNQLDDDDRTRRRHAIAVAFREVTEGERVWVGGTVQIPAVLAAELGEISDRTRGDRTTRSKR